MIIKRLRAGHATNYNYSRADSFTQNYGDIH